MQCNPIRRCILLHCRYGLLCDGAGGGEEKEQHGLEVAWVSFGGQVSRNGDVHCLRYALLVMFVALPQQK